MALFLRSLRLPLFSPVSSFFFSGHPGGGGRSALDGISRVNPTRRHGGFWFGPGSEGCRVPAVRDRREAPRWAAAPKGHGGMRCGRTPAQDLRQEDCSPNTRKGEWGGVCVCVCVILRASLGQLQGATKADYMGERHDPPALSPARLHRPLLSPRHTSRCRGHGNTQQRIAVSLGLLILPSQLK